MEAACKICGKGLGFPAWGTAFCKPHVAVAQDWWRLIQNNQAILVVRATAGGWGVWRNGSKFIEFSTNAAASFWLEDSGYSHTLSTLGGYAELWTREV